MYENDSEVLYTFLFINKITFHLFLIKFQLFAGVTRETKKSFN